MPLPRGRGRHAKLPPPRFVLDGELVAFDGD
jgi:hypothetical protein